MALPLDVKRKFDDILDTQLGLEFRSQFSNLTAISLDWKIVGGFYEKKPAIVFYVIRKGVIPIGDKLLPETIDGIETDVREGFYELTGNYSEDCRKYLYNVSTGCSIGIAGNTLVGTLGAFVKQNDLIHLLTNDHVICSDNQRTICQPADVDHIEPIEKNLKYERERLENPQSQEEEEEIRTRINRLEVDLEKAKNKNTQFATYKNGLRDNYVNDGKNYGVDAAIASLNPGSRPTSVNHFVIRGPAFEEMSINSSIRLSGFKDIKTVDDSEPIFKVGRTSGLTEGRIQEIDKPVYSTDGSQMILKKQHFIFHGVLMEKIKVQGVNNFPSKWLDRQILVRPKGDDPFMKGGDSGCIWFDKDGDMIALGHGTLCLSMGNYAVGSPINAVFSALDVNPIFNN
jgi:hypothetical protein